MINLYLNSQTLREITELSVSVHIEIRAIPNEITLIASQLISLALLFVKWRLLHETYKPTDPCDAITEKITYKYL